MRSRYGGRCARGRRSPRDHRPSPSHRRAGALGSRPASSTGEQSFAQLAHLLELDVTARAAERLLEALVVERLDEIVDGGEVERLERIPIVRRHEDRRRHLVGPISRTTSMPVLPGICTSRKTRSGCSERTASTAAVPLSRWRRSATASSARAGPRPLAREGLVVDDEHANRLAFGHGPALGVARHGFACRSAPV
jgi:hypothetical protein